MKKILTTLMGLGVLTLSCQADVLVYNLSTTDTLTGNGPVQKISVSGFFVIDPTNFFIADIRVVGAQKEFQIFQFSNGTIVGAAANTKTDTAIFIPENSTGSIFLTGANAPLVTGTVSTYSYPKTMTFTGRELTPGLSTGDTFQQDNGTVSYNQTVTLQQNGLDGDFNNTVSRLAQTLINAGYTQLPTVTN